MDFFNRISILIVLIIKTAALAMIMLAVGVWFMSISGIVASHGLPIFKYELAMMCGICLILDLLTSWFMYYVPAYVEPPKPIGWRPPPEEKRSKHDGPFA